MIRKILILLGTSFLLVIVVISCDTGFCKDVDYYDFSEVHIQIKGSATIGEMDSLNFEIRQLDTRYMAQDFRKINLIKSSYALNCDYGWNGMKIQMTKIEITSNSDFNEEHPAHTLLNDIIIVKILKDDSSYPPEYVYNNVDSVEFEKLLPREEFLNPSFYIVEHPTNDLTHQLTVKIFKSNGDIIMSESDQIFWD